MHRRIVLTVVILILLVLILACGAGYVGGPHCYSNYPGCSATAAVIATAAAK